MIVALPATVTGSIGVLGGKFVTAGLMERLGLTTGTVAQGDRALMYSSRRRFDEEERANSRRTVDAIYADFVGKVASAGAARSTRSSRWPAAGSGPGGTPWSAAWSINSAGCGRRSTWRAAGRVCATTPRWCRPVHLPWFARLGRPRNSEDPRALATATLPGLSDLASALGGLDAIALRMPPLRLR